MLIEKLSSIPSRTIVRTILFIYIGGAIIHSIYTMKRTPVLIPVFLFFACLYLSCNKNNDSGSGNRYKPEYVTATITGRVTDDEKKPVSGAIVRAGAAYVATNVDGVFTLDNVTVDKKAAFLKVEKPGFFLGTKTIVTGAGKNHQVAIRLIKKTVAGNISATAGGTVNVPANGGSITFEANSIIKASDNKEYTGTVAVNAFFINPEASDFNEIMPAALRGINMANEETGLQSFGMLAVDLNGSVGEKLLLAPGKTATLHFPIPAGLQGEAPATIPLWSLDESTGFWKEEGTATREGNEYVGTVSHFSFWNCDAPFQVIEFTGTIRNQQGNAMNEAEVVIAIPPGGNTAGSIAGNGFTNEDGVISGKIPANKTLQLIVYNKCRALLHTETIGPFSADTDLGAITVNSNFSQVTFSGTVVNCSNIPLTNGFVTIKLEDIFYNAPVSNGSFNYTITRCGSNDVTASLVAIDPIKKESGHELFFPVTGNTVNTGELLACGGTMDTYIRYNVNGVSYQLLPPQDTVRVYEVNGNSRLTFIEGKRPGNYYEDIVISFTGEHAPGKYPLIITDISFGDSTVQWMRNDSYQVNVTEYGPAGGGYVSGTFSCMVSDTSGTKVAPLSCSFRVKRP